MTEKPPEWSATVPLSEGGAPVGAIAAILIVLALSVLSSLRVHPGEEAWPDGRVP